MFNLFGLCSGSSKTKIKPGQIAVQTYQSNNLKRRDIIPQLFSPNQNLTTKKSLKYYIPDDQTLKPILTSKHNSYSFTQTNGDQFTFSRTVQKSNFQQIHENLKQKNQKFTDPQFPPNNDSIGKDSQILKKTVKWGRLSQIYINPVFFANDVDPNDIIQGYNGGSANCYFLSALSNLARNPSRIKQIFGNTEVSQQGIYYVRLFHKGVFRQIVVDDYIPLSSTGPYFSKPPEGSQQIWVQIVQKAYAKLFGSYSSMNGGLPSQAYYALSGVPTFYYNLTLSKQNSDKYWSIILDAYNKNYCVDFGTPLVDTSFRSLVRNHAYTMLGAYELQGGIKILRLRNPMGKTQWSGRASDSDKKFWDKISEIDKQLVQYDQKKQNDGIFHILWQDVATYFILFEVCEYKQNANILSIRQTFKMKNANMYEIQVDQGNQAVISFVQDTPRGTGVDLKTYKYSKNYMIVSKATKNYRKQYQYRIVKLAARNSFAAHHQRLSLQPGLYVVYSKYQWIDNIEKQASFIVYADSHVRIRQTKQTEHPLFLQKTFLSVACEIPQYIEQRQKYNYVKRFYGQSGGYGFYAVKVNDDIKQTIQIQLDEQALNANHLILKKPFKNKGKQKITLKKGEQIIIVFRNKDVIIPQNLNVPDLNIKVK